MTDKDKRMLSKKRLMKQMLTNPDSVRSVILYDTQIELFNLIQKMDRGKGVTTKQVAKKRKGSIPVTSQLMCRLYKKDYLTRTKTYTTTGALEYRYKVAFEI